MAATNINILKNLNVPDKDKFSAVLTFVKSFGEVDASNKSSILTRIRGIPLLDTLDRMLTDEQWLDETSGEDIGTCSRFLHDIKTYLIEEENILLDRPGTSMDGMSNNQQRRNTCQQYAKMTVPNTWINVENIQIWPLIILKTSAPIKRPLNKTKPQAMRSIVEKILEDTAVDAGGIIEIEEGHSSIKIKCDSIASRTRILRFLTPKLPRWTLTIPPLRDPLIMIKNVSIDPSKELALNNWLAKLIARNGWQNPDNKIRITYWFKKPNGIDLLLSIPPVIREKIERRNGSINLGYRLAQAIDYFDIKFCTTCCSYGHSTTKCALISKCGYCSEVHGKTCPVKNDPTRHRCPNCFKQGENAFDKKCQVYQTKLRHEMEKTNFNYKFIMA
ncbi:uncharacterized protein LOC112539386 isoform X2 [Tetranychus urticae]|uniref:uncharacterized protein LOC112539386 isoform X2 n=1 Tax=Tetranychus urticae TaxID=32264 RepID=UPI000D6549E9|nr:uncharacterized protein LOC112539386 isoform X2 [Tetranychus urticae]